MTTAGEEVVNWTTWQWLRPNRTSRLRPLLKGWNRWHKRQWQLSNRCVARVHCNVVCRHRWHCTKVCYGSAVSALINLQPVDWNIWRKWKNKQQQKKKKIDERIFILKPLSLSLCLFLTVSLSSWQLKQKPHVCLAVPASLSHRRFVLSTNYSSIVVMIDLILINPHPSICTCVRLCPSVLLSSRQL